MENILLVAVGALLLVIGYLLAFKEKINLLHSYHYKRVLDEDKPIVCKYTGLGNILAGIGIITEPIISFAISELVALILCGIFVVTGMAIMLITIIKYNKGLL